MMEEELTTNLCVFCCRVFPPPPPSSTLSSSSTAPTPTPDQKPDLRSIAGGKVQVDFASISKTLLELPDEKDDDDQELVSALETFEALSVCRECHILVTAGMEFKRQSADSEKVVAQLQLEILEQLRKLHSYTNDYYMEMKKMEEVLVNSSISTLQNYLVEHSPAPGGRVKAKGVMKFREKFLAVVEQLEFYQRLISPKVDCLSAAIEEDVNAGGVFRHEQKPRIPRRKHITPAPLPIKVEKETRSEAENEEDAGDNDHVTFDDDDEPFEMIEMEPDIEFYSEEDAEFEFATDDDYGSDYLPSEGEELGMEHPITLEMKREKERAKRKEYKKRAKIKKREDRLNRINQATKGMTSFKRDIVLRVRRRLEGPLKKSKKKMQNSDTLLDLIGDPRKNFVIEYNPERNTLTVGEIDIFINEDEHFLECSLCSFRVFLSQQERLRRPLEKVMANHMFGKHLGTYTCTICTATFQSFSRYRYHLNSHQNPYTCDVCGKPMSGKDAVATHKWSHMSPEEAAAAIASGVKDPRERVARAKTKALLMNCCKVCGKAFSSITFLRNHEDTHLPPEERERIICPTCGKSLTRNGFVSHQRYSCVTAEITGRVKCSYCPNTYKSKPLLQRHVAREHNGALPGSAEERPFQCSICAKTFKGKSDLKKHESTHSDARPFVCSKCPANFKMRKHCTRHEKKCDGQSISTPRGRKIPQTPMAVVSTSTLQTLTETVPKIEAETMLKIAQLY